MSTTVAPAPPSVGSPGSLFDGGVTFPAMVVRWPTVLRNIALFQAYCASHGADLAPHGKTTMNRELFRAQLEAGAWGITVASPAQARVARDAGAARIILANEVTGEPELAALLEVADDPAVELLTLVDSEASVERLAGAIRAARPTRPVQVLLEIGYDGGRAGVRDDAGLASTLAALATARPSIVLRGFEAYEGLIEGPDIEARIVAVDGFLERLASIATAHRDRIVHPDPVISAGGSAFVDRVLDVLGPSRLPGWHLVVRSGVYVTHDSGAYDRLSPLSARVERFVGGESLKPALELWSRVLSRPEPGLALLGVGHRETPSRLGMPVPLLRRSDDGRLQPIDATTASISGMNDHHAYLRLAPSDGLAVGDLVGLGISHPCEAFEKWRTVIAVDEDRVVLRSLQTQF